MFGRKNHDCLPPSGLVFDPLWICAECGATWQLHVHANDSEWVRLTAGGET